MVVRLWRRCLPKAVIPHARLRVSGRSDAEHDSPPRSGRCCWIMRLHRFPTSSVDPSRRRSGVGRAEPRGGPNRWQAQGPCSLQPASLPSVLRATACCSDSVHCDGDRTARIGSRRLTTRLSRTCARTLISGPLRLSIALLAVEQCYKYEDVPGPEKDATVYISFGGLLMALRGSTRHLAEIVVGENVYCLIRK
jgi:hypothetical protein